MRERGERDRETESEGRETEKMRDRESHLDALFWADGSLNLGLMWDIENWFELSFLPIQIPS